MRVQCVCTQARLWRLILSQSVDGYWDASPTTALALQARTAAEVAELKPTWRDRLTSFVRDHADAGAELMHGNVLNALDGNEQQEQRRSTSAAAEQAALPADATPVTATAESRSAAKHPPTVRAGLLTAVAMDVNIHADSSSPPEAAATEETEEVHDDPLQCSAAAITAAMPRRLKALHGPDVNVARVWSTLCCIAFLETLTFSWLWGDGDLYPAEEHTIVDAADAWVREYAAQRPALAEALADGAIAKAATSAVAQWHRAWEKRVDELRRSEAITNSRGIANLHRSACEMIRAVTTRHETVRACVRACVCVAVRAFAHSLGAGTDAAETGRAASHAVCHFPLCTPGWPSALADVHDSNHPRHKSGALHARCARALLTRPHQRLDFLFCALTVDHPLHPPARVSAAGQHLDVRPHARALCLASLSLPFARRWHVPEPSFVKPTLSRFPRFYAKGVNCCAEVRFLLGDLALGMEATLCGDLAVAFASTPVPPYFPDGLADYTCHAFPDDDAPRDSFIVALIALAVALPVSLFLGSCFEIANDNEAPESWLFYAGIPRLVCGMRAHRRWHYIRDSQPARFVKWYSRCVDAPMPETITNLWESLKALATRTKPPWTLEAEEAEAEAVGHVVPLARRASVRVIGSGNGDDRSSAPPDAAPQRAGEEKDGGGSSAASSADSAVDLQRSKRRLTAAGLLGVYLTWAIFAWFIFTYGMLVYKLLGASAQDSFARSWGVSYGVGAAAEWKEVGKEALKAAVVLIILERLFLTRPAAWMEAHIDYLSVQALLFEERMSFFGQTRMLFAFQKRVSTT